MVPFDDGGNGRMNDTNIHSCFRLDVAAYMKACDRLLRGTSDVPLSPHEKEMILLYTRKMIEAFLSSHPFSSTPR